MLSYYYEAWHYHILSDINNVNFKCKNNSKIGSTNIIVSIEYQFPFKKELLNLRLYLNFWFYSKYKDKMSSFFMAIGNNTRP